MGCSESDDDSPHSARARETYANPLIGRAAACAQVRAQFSAQEVKSTRPPATTAGTNDVVAPHLPSCRSRPCISGPRARTLGPVQVTTVLPSSQVGRLPGTDSAIAHTDGRWHARVEVMQTLDATATSGHVGQAIRYVFHHATRRLPEPSCSHPPAMPIECRPRGAI